MKIRIALAASALLAASAVPVVVATPAHAGWPGGELTHNANDEGYTGRGGAIFYRCNTGHDLDLYPGQWSKSSGCADVDYMYVFPEERAVCKGNVSTGGATKTVYYPGMSIGNFQGWTCVMQLR